MNKKTFILFVWMGATFLALPFAAQAFEPPALSGGGVINVLVLFDRIFSFLWPLFIVFSILMFIFAGYMFLSAREDAGKIKMAKTALFWGIIGVAVGILAFSLPFIVSSVLGV